MTKNDLTQLIPGYKAPLELTSSKSSTLPSISQMRRKALAAEASRANKTTGMTITSGGNSSSTPPKVSFKTGKLSKAAIKEMKSGSAGSKWFGMRPTPMTDDLKRDLQVLANRNYLDPKRFYKKSSADDLKGTMFLQRGTVIEGTGEFFSARLSQKQRKSNVTDEIMSDAKIRTYAKSQFLKIQAAQQEKARKRRKRC